MIFPHQWISSVHNVCISIQVIQTLDDGNSASQILLQNVCSVANFEPLPSANHKINDDNYLSNPKQPSCKKRVRP